MTDKKLNSILVVGSTRGIGLELVKQFLKLKPIQVIATYRSFNSATELKKLKTEYSNLKLLKLDLIDFDSYNEFFCQVDQLVGDNGLEIFVHNAGILIEDKIDSITADNMINAFKINTISPILLTKHLLPLLKRSASNIQTTKAVYMSSILGSIEHNDGDRYSHRISKCGLNQGVQTFAKDLKSDYKIEFVLFHPGLVKTEMSNFEGDIDVETSVSGMIKVLFSEMDRNNKLIAWNGQIIEW